LSGHEASPGCFEKVVRQRRAKQTRADAWSIRAQKKRGTFMGRFIRGSFALENDISLYSVDMPEVDELFRRYIARFLAHGEASIRQYRPALENILATLMRMLDQVGAPHFQNRDEILDKIIEGIKSRPGSR
jgi:hypothetical protein